MGDVIHAIPAVTALRRALRQSEIGWMIDPRWAPLLATKEQAGAKEYLVDDVYLADMKMWRRLPFAVGTRRAIAAIRRETQKKNYDVAIDLQGALRSAVMGKLSGARQLVGDRDPREPGSQLFYNRSFAAAGTHVIEQAHTIICAMLGRRVPLAKPIMPRDPAAESWVDWQLRKRAVSEFVLINPGAGWGAKCWPAQRYGEVAKQVATAGLAVIANLGPEEARLGDQVREASAGKAIPVQCSVAQLVSLTRRAKLFIGGDTGPMHLAAALEVPVVGIFGPTDPARNGPFATKNIVLRHPQSRRDHARRSEPEKGLLEISVEEVAAAARQLLGLSA